MALCALLLPVLAAAQLSVLGKITDRQTGGALPGATITIAPGVNTVSDADGNYRLGKIAAGNYTLTVTYIGYQTAEKSLSLTAGTVVNFELNSSITLTEEVTVSATRAAKNSPTAYTNLNRKQIQENNLGQDLPFLFNQTPSVVTTSDAG